MRNGQGEGEGLVDKFLFPFFVGVMCVLSVKQIKGMYKFSFLYLKFLI